MHAETKVSVLTWALKENKYQLLFKWRDTFILNQI